ncbi:hypothetical protein ACIA03_22895 [Nocardioides sp. NPDC051685]|uniref:hypothetical protein n=1 Tax=Nocardioides sp. NPDC051685 TaxID=3364334 RepID=UPI0037A49534
MMRLGLYGVLATYVALVLLGVLAQPIFAPDEAGHVHYGISLTQGRIPLVGETSASQFPEINPAEVLQIQSFHPPLYYVLSGPIQRLAMESGADYPLLLLTRLLNLAISALTVLLVGRIAWLVTSGTTRYRAAVVLAASAVAAGFPALLTTSGRMLNDPLAVALVTGTLLAIVHAARSGLRWRTVGLVALLCTLGMLTRISFAPVWLLAVGAVFTLTLWPGLNLAPLRTSPWRRALAHMAVVVAAPVAGAGWFYALNLSRYGDITGGAGGKDLPVAADRTLDPAAAHGPVLYLLEPDSWWEQMQQYAGVNASSVREPLPLFNTVLVIAVVAVMVVGILVRLLRRVEGHPPATDTIGTWCLVALALVAVAICLEMALHVTHKGWPNARYLLNAVSVWAIAAAGLAYTFGRRAGPCAVTLITFTGALGYLTLLVSTLRWNNELERLSWFDTIAGGMSMSDVPVPHLLTGMLLAVAVAGLGLQTAALIGLSHEPAAGRHSVHDPEHAATSGADRRRNGESRARVLRRSAATSHRRGTHRAG